MKKNLSRKVKNIGAIGKRCPYSRVDFLDFARYIWDMNTITIPKTEYKKLKQQSSLFVKIVEEIVTADFAYSYDYKYINNLVKKTLTDFNENKCIKAESVDKALAKFKKK